MTTASGSRGSAASETRAAGNGRYTRLGSTSDIWLRQAFSYDGTPFGRALLVTHYDNATEFYLNGVLDPLSQGLERSIRRLRCQQERQEGHQAGAQRYRDPLPSGQWRAVHRRGAAHRRSRPVGGVSRPRVRAGRRLETPPTRGMAGRRSRALRPGSRPSRHTRAPGIRRIRARIHICRTCP